MSRLTVVTDYYPYLTETFISRQINYLQPIVISKRIDNHIFSKFHPNYKPEYIALEKGEPSFQKKVLDFLNLLQWKFLNKPVFYWNKDLKKNLCRNLKRINPDVLLAHYGTTGINCMETCKTLKIPLAVHFNGVDASSLLDNPYYSQDLKKLFQNAEKLIVVNSVMKKEFLRLGCAQEKIEIIPYGIPLQEFPYLKRNFNGTFEFIAVGRLVPKKSPVSLVKAFEICALANPNVKLTIIGGGILEEELRSYVGKSIYKEKIDILGAQPLEVIKSELAKAHTFLQHSVTPKNKDKEGWPLAIAEACASGLPVISTNHTGIKDQIIHGKTGFLVDEYDYKSMGKFMIEISSSFEKAMEMGQRSMENIHLNGNFTTQIQALEEVLSKIAKN
ncbi:glycosyltransferase [Flexithrix dorotheae]|uniref:glycosyltransferase n=1 Tax=Flexithrix dorotheae TaxID=70993 RepID=UPI00035C6557|nr:glycosyltransferase [Flexithrix dorotheae]